MISIAGSRICVVSSTLALTRLDRPEYAEFVSDDPCPEGPADMRVDVLAESPPPVDGDLVFDSGSPWIMYRDGSGYRLEFRRVDHDQPHTVVRVDADATSAVVHLLEPSGRAAPNPFCYPLDELLLMNHLASRGGVVVHSAGVRVDVGSDVVGLVLPGVSGAGKTTLSEALTAQGMGESLLSDDRMALRVESDGRVAAWGTPWPGDAGIARNQRVPLSSLLFLVQSDEDRVIALTAGETLRRLMPVVMCPWYDRERFPGVLDTCGRIAEAVPGHELRFTRTGPVVEVLTRHAEKMSEHGEEGRGAVASGMLRDGRLEGTP